MAAKLLAVEVSIYWWICLAIAIWIIYTVDHLVDALKIPFPEERRKFYHKNFTPLLYTSIGLVLVSSLIGVFYLPAEIIILGFVLGLISGVYLLIVFVFGQTKNKWLQKELYVAGIYTLGVWAPVILVSKMLINIEIVLVVVAFFLLVFSDILIFSIYDHQQDSKNQFISLIKIVGIKKLTNLTISSIVISILIPVVLVFSNQAKIQATAIILIAMGLMLLFLFVQKKKLAGQLYRYLGEAVFFLPVLVALYF